MTDTLNLPAGVSTADFDNALKEYIAVVGKDNVIVAPEAMAPYLKAYIPIDEKLYAPSGAIAVSSVEEIQAVLKICHKYGIPVWPISTGRNFGYGTALPAVPGQLLLDLRKMNKIIHIDPELGTALVEPGVTYAQLHAYLAEHKIPLWLSVPGPGPLVGPVGQTLIRGEGYTAYAEQFSSCCGMEVVLADGQVVRTGLGGIEGTSAWQTNKYGYGPYLDGIFSQSNFGIVTKLGLWLMPAPESYEVFTIGFPAYSDLEKAVEMGRRLKLSETVRSPLLIASTATGMALAGVPRSVIKPEPGALTAEDIQAFAQKNKQPTISVSGALYGTREQIAAHLKLVEKEARDAGGMLLHGEQLNVLPEKLAHHFRDIFTGTPNLQEFALLNWIGGGGLIWFAPICPTRGSEAMKQVEMMKSLATEFGFDFIDAFFLNGRSMVHLFNLFYNRSDADQVKRAYAFFEKAQATFAKAGYGVYRSNPAFMKKTAEVYGQAQMDINRRIKKALDPKGILAPGMSGITI
ncbi:FAD-binding oxidoreductase [Pseudomonas panipatensis]|uniref:4-cresol dehydrogenase (Hydroxylating) n=1 Tax=Pseudomonas panipatensis TaxID=428992 RepID=A0A1G8KX03_9PSED|nr:FAD-binding oxidoreductase [Pseudomonas panipatensis]SDI47916.1 4-cresol dehydrogenase (hydroxylating) [Pseudomonas panipatensis]SMP73089.1 4-cresol dehydrogenase (hydroxylating) [Pseudomonas panipatensis]